MAQPNFLIILTDDQDSLLGGLQPMEKTRRLLTERGVSFANAFVATPLCCPSRASYLTGLYPQSTLTTTNALRGGCASSSWVDGAERRTFAALLQRQGYRTGFSGKYLNNYAMPGSPDCPSWASRSCFRRVPPGWDDWFALQGNARYYNGRVSDNGVLRSFGREPADYLPEVFFKRTRGFIEAHLGNRTRQQPFLARQQPFLAVLSTPSCHSATLQSAAEPSPAHAGRFRGARAPRTPNWNASAAHKHWLMRRAPPLSAETARLIDRLHSARWEALLAVDDQVDELVATLRRWEQLDSTYVMLTSDHGYQLGQHRRPADKRQPYEHNLRVPLLVAGPAPGVRTRANFSSTALVVASIDLAPTLLHLATGTPPAQMDGRSFAHHLMLDGGGGGDGGSGFGSAAATTTTTRRDFLVVYAGEGQAPCGLAACWCAWVTKKGEPKRADCSTAAAKRALARGAVRRSGARHLLDAANNSYACVRTLDAAGAGGGGGDGGGEDTLYCAFDDDERFVELYDHRSDPWQLHNVASAQSAAPMARRYAARLSELRGCRAEKCRR